MSDIQTLRAQLQKVHEELADMPTAYSQSNPGIVLGLRALHRKKAAIERKIEEALKGQSDTYK
jgi:uncharacterized protein involved in exopolysaccharide biosynthesis